MSGISTIDLWELCLKDAEARKSNIRIKFHSGVEFQGVPEERVYRDKGWQLVGTDIQFSTWELASITFNC